jgi:hypothetical protein
MWESIEKLGTIIGIISAMIAALNTVILRRETKRQWQKENEQIRVILRSDTREIPLPVELQRGGLTRAELLGLIGMLPMQEKGKRFELYFLHTHEFSQRLAMVRNSDVDFEFVVQCSEEELEQFKCELKPVSLSK